MKEMTKEGKTLNALELITPDTSWSGETSHDKKSFDNLDLLEDMIYHLYWQLVDNIDVGLKHKDDASANAITKKKYYIVKMFYNAFRNDKCAIEKKMNKPKTDDDDGTMTDSKALQIATDYISKRISELREADNATKQDDPKHNKIIDELWALMQVRTALTNMEIDKEDEEAK